MPSTVTVNHDHPHVAVVEFANGPGNYFDADLLMSVTDALNDLAGDGTTRAAVLCSIGRHFCAGANFGSPELTADREGVARQIYTQAERLLAVDLPVVAAVQGAAVGGGLGLACAADFRTASPSTTLHANFTALGFHHGFALTVTLPHIVGHRVAADLLLRAQRLDGTQAHEVGLVDRVVAEGEERAAALVLASELAALAPLAVRSVRRTLRRDIVESAQSAIAAELVEQASLWRTRDSEIGLAAARNRTTPVFEGR